MWPELSNRRRSTSRFLYARFVSRPDLTYSSGASCVASVFGTPCKKWRSVVKPRTRALLSSIEVTGALPRGSDRRRSPWASPSYRQRSRTGRHGADKIELVARIRLPVGAELPIAPQRRLNERVTASSSRPKSVLSSRVSRAQGHARRSIGRHSQRRTGPEPASRAAQAAIGV